MRAQELGIRGNSSLRSGPFFENTKTGLGLGGRDCIRQVSQALLTHHVWAVECPRLPSSTLERRRSNRARRYNRRHPNRVCIMQMDEGLDTGPFCKNPFQSDRRSGN